MSWLEGVTPATPADCLWAVLTTLKASSLGGTSRFVRTSGTGAAGVYSQAGDVWLSVSALAGVGAWAVLRGRPFWDGPEISGQECYREWCFQVDGAGGLRVLYSPRLGFVGGSPSPSRVPTAADQRTWIGGGTDAAPTYENLLPTGHRVVGFASEYDDAWWFLGYPVGGGPASFLWFVDLTAPELRADSGALLDSDPAVLYARAGASCALEADLSSEAVGPRSVFARGSAAELWGRCPAELSYVRDAAGVLRPVFPGGGSSSLLYSVPSYPEAPLRYVRRAALSGTLQPGEAGNPTTCDEKRTSANLAWTTSPAHGIPTLLDRLDPVTRQPSAGTALALGNLVFAWSGAALLL